MSYWWGGVPVVANFRGHPYMFFGWIVFGLLGLSLFAYILWEE